MFIYQSSPQKTLFELEQLELMGSNGTNGLTRSKLFFILSSSECFTEVATSFKSY